MIIPKSRTARAQARFRINAPNSQPRTITVVALDPVGEGIVRQLMRHDWTRTNFLLASVFANGDFADPSASGSRFSITAWLDDLGARVQCLVGEIENADIVVMVTSAGDIADAASLIGEACAAHHTMTTALVVTAADTSEATLAATMSALRPYASMIGVGDDEDFVRAMLTAFGA
jgi:hypothetical protein